MDAAARYGLVEAQVLLGQMLLDGRGARHDPPRAFRWFSIAANAGHPPAMNMVGRCYENGWGVGRDYPAAAAWYRRAAEASLDWGQYNFANMLLRGRGIARDREAAFAWYMRAARQQHAKSMNLVGRFLEEGWDRPPDPAAAVAWYRRAAEGGDYRGQYNLATCLARQGDIAGAACWFETAVAAASSDVLQIVATALCESAEPAFREIGHRAASRLAGAAPTDGAKDQGHRESAPVFTFVMPR
jgi:TPR repeat protein